jgi:CDP-6-deoxy-D-xylo-4-hexulose-3-dehydrase
MRSEHQISEIVRKKISNLISEEWHNQESPNEFLPGITPVPVSGKVYDENDIDSLVQSSLDFWLTSGKYNSMFEKNLKDFLGTRYAITCNSGSSANLLAFTSLTSNLLGKRKINKGDEIITVAAGFPTTVAPIIQNNCIPVFLDIKIEDYNIDVKYLKQAISKNTKAIFLAHTLGQPFDLDTVKDFCQENNLFLIEDSCDALGSEYKGKLVGSFGDLSTYSFYPAHHITMGEGGAIATNRPVLKRAVESFRDWGRDCWCEPGQDNTCKKRFDHDFPGMPIGYDHKFTFSHIGYNLKLTDMQAAIGCSQLTKIQKFISNRRQNYDFYAKNLEGIKNIILPVSDSNVKASPFGFPISIKPGSGLKLQQVLKELDNAKIGNRPIFAGNITRQPAYKNEKFKIVGELPVTDFVMNNTFWIGVWPGLTEEMRNYTVQVLYDIFNK